MQILLIAICILSLNLSLSNATKKEDLERAAELAVERAAERVAERAVEKALEAGNSSSTTVTVREGYSNARKVAEEQAAPGSESTRYAGRNHQYSIDFGRDSREYHNTNHGSSREYEYADEEDPKEIKGDAEYNDDSHHGPRYGQKDVPQIELKDESPDYHDVNIEHPVADEETYLEEGDLSHESKAWKDYSNWESNFKPAQSENWTGKSFWSSGDDSFFWDMEDSETRNNLKNRVHNVTLTEPHTGGSENHIWKNKDFLSHEFFQWPVEKKYSTPSPRRSDSENENNKEEYKFPDFWSSEKHDHTFEKNRSPGKNRARSNKWEVVHDAPKPVFKTHEEFRMDTSTDSEAIDKGSWTSADPDKSVSWMEKNSDTDDGISAANIDKSWELEDADMEDKMIREFMENDSGWESDEISDEKMKVEQTQISKSEENNDASTSASDWTKDTLNPDNYTSIETFGREISKLRQLNMENEKMYPHKNYRNKNNHSKLNSIKNHPSFRPPSENDYHKEFIRIPVYQKNKKPRRSNNSYRDHSEKHRLRSPYEDSETLSATVEDYSIEEVPKTALHKRFKKMSRSLLPGYVLGVQKPSTNKHNYYSISQGNENRNALFRVKKHLPVYYTQNHHPYYYNAQLMNSFII